MRRAILCLVLLVAFAGCSVPAAIRTEIDFLDVVISTAVTETAEISDPSQRADKAVRALKRAEPHAANLRRWAAGEEAVDGD
jgi:hypothetical protein